MTYFMSFAIMVHLGFRTHDGIPLTKLPYFVQRFEAGILEGIQNCILQITAVIDAVQSYEFWGCCRHMKDVVSQNMGFMCAGLCHTACHGPEPASRHSLVFRFLCPPEPTCQNNHDMINFTVTYFCVCVVFVALALLNLRSRLEHPESSVLLV